MEKAIVITCGLITLASVTTSIILGIKLKNAETHFFIKQHLEWRRLWDQCREFVEQGKLPGAKPEDFDLDAND